MLDIESPFELRAKRLNDLQRFYALMHELSRLIGGPRLISECSGRLDWPQRGVYFFMEPGEIRGESGQGSRIVRVGTHALKEGSRTALWTRLSQHKGQRSGGGNHRGSIFRLLVGTALLVNDTELCASWGKGNTAAQDIREGERELESRVSRAIGQMSVIFLDVSDDAGPRSLRGMIERNAIALLSNSRKTPLDTASDMWLGRHCPRERVRASHLWNQNHVGEAYDPAFLDKLEALIGVERTFP